MLLLFAFSDYPLEKFAVGATLLNPIDLARILVILKLDSAVMLGYTGAVFSKFFGSLYGMLASSAILIVWVLAPMYLFLKIWNKKDF